MIKIIYKAIENDLIKSKDDEETEQKRVNEYLINKYQKLIYEDLKSIHALNSEPYHAKLAGNASIIALRIGSNADKRSYNIARNVIRDMDKALSFGAKINCIPAYFSKIYNDRLVYGTVRRNRVQVPSKVPERDTSFYYNWLEED